MVQAFDLHSVAWLLFQAYPVLIFSNGITSQPLALTEKITRFLVSTMNERSRYLPSAITHAVVGISSGLAISKGRTPKRFFAMSMICAMLSDLDVLTFKFGISYGSFWGHRGFFHSIFFAVLLGSIAATTFLGKEGIISKSWLFYFLYFSVVSWTHDILDAFTNGGLGIALLAPFDNERYFFWATPISVSPLSVKAFIVFQITKLVTQNVKCLIFKIVTETKNQISFLESYISGKGLAILRNEILWVWLPSIFVVIIVKLSHTHSGDNKIG